MSLKSHYCDLVLLDKPGRVLNFSPVFLSTRQIRVLILTSSDMACRCMMQENPAQTIDLRSSITTWASKTFPVLMGLVRLQRTKPGESSSSEIPFTLALIFSPEVTAVTSMSSDQICSTLTSLLLGMISKDSPFLQQPLSTLPMTMVPMSLYLSTIGIMKGPST